ncbi:MAG: hypothetical protein KatS3mg015_1769 [Fimbriimonadales bacterium]|nr:MAG: hypothetical protein KatS3mg015_1769 [Fimbriimonadales bacterium]
MALTALIALSVSVTPFHFPGGGVNDLAATIAKYTGQPCAILMPGSGLYGRPIVSLREVTITPDPERPRESLLEGLEREFGLVAEAKDLNAFSFGMWPCRILRPYYEDCLYGPFSAPSPDSIIEGDGGLTIRLRGNEAIPVSRLEQYLRTGKAISSHWFYQRLALAITAEDVEKDRLLELVAATVGAKIKRSDLGAELLFDASVFARRAAATQEYFARAIGVDSARSTYRFVAEVYRTIPHDLLTEAFRTEHSSVSVGIKRDSRLWALALESARRLAPDIQSGIDLDRGMEYELRAYDGDATIIAWIRVGDKLTRVHF